MNSLINTCYSGLLQNSYIFLCDTSAGLLWNMYLWFSNLGFSKCFAKFSPWSNCPYSIGDFLHFINWKKSMQSAKPSFFHGNTFSLGFMLLGYFTWTSNLSSWATWTQDFVQSVRTLGAFQRVKTKKELT